MAEFKNVFIFVSDALSYNHVPEELVEEADSEVIRTLAPSLHSPKSFVSILTGLESPNHEVYHFGDMVENDNVLEMFENSNFYEHDDNNSAMRYMFGLQDNPELEEMEEPFFWFERSSETHEPYIWTKNHGIHTDEEYPSFDEDYFGNFSDEELREKYEEAAQEAYKHFKRHVNYLEEEGLLEDTLVIFTADHGELLGERVYGRKRYSHNVPACMQLAEVPVLFYNYDPGVKRMRSVDIVPTVLDLLDKSWMMDADGVSILDEVPDEGYCPTGPYVFDLEWEWNSKKETWGLKPKSKVKALIEDVTPEWLVNKVGLSTHEIKFGKDKEKDVSYDD